MEKINDQDQDQEKEVYLFYVVLNRKFRTTGILEELEKEEKNQILNTSIKMDVVEIEPVHSDQNYFHQLNEESYNFLKNYPGLEKYAELKDEKCVQCVNLYAKSYKDFEYAVRTLDTQCKIYLTLPPDLSRELRSYIFNIHYTYSKLERDYA
jgi:hypothetical protein